MLPLGLHRTHTLALKPDIELVTVDVDAATNLDQRRFQSIHIRMEYPPAQLALNQEDRFGRHLLYRPKFSTIDTFRALG